MKVEVLKLGEPTENGRIYDPETTTLKDDSGYVYAFDHDDDFQDLTKIIAAYSLAAIEDGTIVAHIQRLNTPLAQVTNLMEMDYFSQGYGEYDPETGVVSNFIMTSIGAFPKNY